MTFGVELHFVDADDAMVGIGFTQRAAMIDDVIVVGAGDLEDRMMARAGGYGHVLLKDLSDALEGAERFVCNCVGNGVVGPRPAAFGPHQVVFPLTKNHVGPFDIVLGRNLFKNTSIRQRLKAGEVRAHFCDVAMLPAAVNQIPRSIGRVLKYRLVYRLGSIVEFIDEGMTQIIFVRAAGLVGDGNSYSAAGAVVLDVVRAEEKIILPVAFSDGGRPHGAMCPMNSGCIEDVGMFFPMDKVRGGKRVEKDLIIVTGAISREDPILLIEYGGFGIGIPTRKDGVTGFRLGDRASRENQKRNRKGDRES